MNRASDLVREVLLRIRSDRERQLEDLIALCRAESVSTWHLDLRPTAEAVAELMERCGVEPRIVGTRGQPVVIGRARGRTDRTVVFYNHYDVQPPDPLEAWQSPPFEPAVREGRLYARGVADNKGNLVARLEAVRAWNEAAGAPPVSVAFVVEGEEETGSPHLREVVQANAGWLSRAYGVVWEAGYRDSAGRPTVALGVKGILYLELRARGARSDLHSSLATLVPNPAWRLVWALSMIKDEDEHILVDGFYDAVRPPTQADLEVLRAVPDTSADMARQYGLGGLLCGVKGFEANRRNFYEPTATVCGLESGYTGPGEKTVLPSRAMAKLDFRLVPDQDPEDILAKVKAHLKRHGFGDIEVHAYAGEKPARTDPSHPFVTVVRDALAEAYGQEVVVYPTMTGSGPMPVFTDLDLPVVSFGVGHPGSAVHAPNENVILEDYWLGVEAVAVLLERAARGPERR